MGTGKLIVTGLVPNDIWGNQGTKGFEIAGLNSGEITVGDSDILCLCTVLRNGTRRN